MPETPRTDAARLDEIVADAFLRTHEGRSSDDVVIDDERNAAFVEACREQLPDLSAAELNRRLLNLRKQGKLGRVTSRRVRLRDFDRYVHAAEIAARCMEDKYGLTIDTIFCDPGRRKEFDRIARSIVRGYTAYDYRRAALRLRKARRLAPEPIKRLDAFQRQVCIEDARLFEEHPDRVPEAPGIYTFLDDTGYLYLGESRNLRARLRQHLDHSDSRSLARYLWGRGTGKIKIELQVFAPGSEGARTRSRKAFEASLIASRRPRFNIQSRPRAVADPSDGAGPPPGLFA